MKRSLSHAGLSRQVGRVVAVAIVATLIGVGPVFGAALGGKQASRPNVVFILADDLGYGDVACFGGEQCRIRTPHFDRLAKEGMRFTDAHANASVCVPTRMAIMTGRYPWRFGQPGPGGPWGFLGTRFSEKQFTLGDMMRAAGYRTGYVGKWHLGTRMVTNDGKPQGPSNVDYTKPLSIGPPQYGFDDSFISAGLAGYVSVRVRPQQSLGRRRDRAEGVECV